MPLKAGDIVLCMVKRIEPASVLVETMNSEVGSIVMSEIAAGRIRNLREYVAPNKKIVCKVLSIDNGNVQLSLRRVTAKERDECLNRYQKEKNFISLVKAISKDYEKILGKIREDYDLADFVDEIREDKRIIEKYFKKGESEQLVKAINDKKEDEKQVRKVFMLRTLSENGLEEIKSLLSNRDAEINYLGSCQYSITSKGKDFKEANNKAQQILSDISEKAKAKKMFFEIREQN